MAPEPASVVAARQLAEEARLRLPGGRPRRRRRPVALAPPGPSPSEPGR